MTTGNMLLFSILSTMTNWVVIEELVKAKKCSLLEIIDGNNSNGYSYINEG
jgi:hypothetical protein